MNEPVHCSGQGAQTESVLISKGHGKEGYIPFYIVEGEDGKYAGSALDHAKRIFSKGHSTSGDWIELRSGKKTALARIPQEILEILEVFQRWKQELADGTHEIKFYDEWVMSEGDYIAFDLVMREK